MKSFNEIKTILNQEIGIYVTNFGEISYRDKNLLNSAKRSGIVNKKEIEKYIKFVDDEVIFERRKNKIEKILSIFS